MSPGWLHRRGHVNCPTRARAGSADEPRVSEQPDRQEVSRWQFMPGEQPRRPRSTRPPPVRLGLGQVAGLAPVAVIAVGGDRAALEVGPERDCGGSDGAQLPVLGVPVLDTPVATASLVIGVARAAVLHDRRAFHTGRVGREAVRPLLRPRASRRARTGGIAVRCRGDRPGVAPRPGGCGGSRGADGSATGLLRTRRRCCVFRSSPKAVDRACDAPAGLGGKRAKR